MNMKENEDDEDCVICFENIDNSKKICSVLFLYEKIPL